MSGSEKLKIERGIPVPARGGKKARRPFEEMEVGDSFFEQNGKLQTISSHAYYVTKTSGKKFSLRSVDGGIRVWRVS